MSVESRSTAASRTSQTPHRPHRARAVRGVTPALQALEDRRLLTAPFPVQYDGQPTSNGGDVLTGDIPVYLIFAGGAGASYGADGSVTTQQITNAVNNILNSSYLGGLYEYGASTRAHLAQTYVSSYGLPTVFNDDGNGGDINNLVSASIKDAGGQLPEPDDTDTNGIYLVVTPQGYSLNGGLLGHHSSGHTGSIIDRDTAYDGVVTSSIQGIPVPAPTFHQPRNQLNFTSLSALDTITETLAHELVEMITDPDNGGVVTRPGTAFAQTFPANHPTEDQGEIGDNEAEFYVGYENGTRVQSYWSARGGDYIIPGGTRNFLALNGGTLTVKADPLLTLSAQSLVVGTTPNGGVQVVVNGETQQFDPGQITTIDVSLGAGTNTVWIDSLPAGVTVAIDGAGGTNTLIGPDRANVWTVTGPDAGNLDGVVTFASVQNLTGGNGPDRFVIQPGGRVSGNLDGGAGGGNTLDESALTGPVVVNLQSQSATAVGGMVSRVDAFVGTGASDTFIGADTPNIWSLDGAGGGSVGGVAFTSFENVVGGAAADRFDLLSPVLGSSSGGRTLTIDGGPGANSLVVTGGAGALGGVDRTDASTAYKGAVTLADGASNRLNVGYQRLQAITMSQLSRLAFVTPDVSNDLTVDAPAAGQNRITGTGGGNSVAALTFFATPSVTVDTSTGDYTKSTRVTVSNPGGPALVAAGLKDFTITTGAGNDALAVNASDLRLPVAGGAFTFDAGTGRYPDGTGASNLRGLISLDRVAVNADADFRLADRPHTMAGGGPVPDDTPPAVDLTLSQPGAGGADLGTLTLVGVEVAALTGGPSTTRIDASGFSGAAVLRSGGGNDTILGGTGDNMLYGGAGSDILIAGAARTGGTSATVLGGGGTNLLVGGPGNETMIAGTGTTTMLGGSGRNQFLVDNPAGGLLAPAGRISVIGGGGAANDLVLRHGGGAGFTEVYTVGGAAAGANAEAISTLSSLGLDVPARLADARFEAEITTVGSFAGAAQPPATQDVRVSGLTSITDDVAAGTLLALGTPDAGAIGLGSGTRLAAGELDLTTGGRAFAPIKFSGKGTISVIGAGGTTLASHSPATLTTSPVVRGPLAVAPKPAAAAATKPAASRAAAPTATARIAVAPVVPRVRPVPRPVHVATHRTR